jgi:hypothetical protein
MSTLLVEALLLGDGELGAVWPVVRQGIDAKEEVVSAVAVPVDADRLHDPDRPKAKVDRNPQWDARGEGGGSIGALVLEEDEPVLGESDEVEPRFGTISDHGQTAKAVEPRDGLPRVKAKDQIARGVEASEDPGGSPRVAAPGADEEVAWTVAEPVEYERLGVPTEPKGRRIRGRRPA